MPHPNPNPSLRLYYFSPSGRVYPCDLLELHETTAEVRFHDPLSGREEVPLTALRPSRRRTPTMPAYSIPPFSRWDTYGGGTATSPRRSYHVPVFGGRASVHGSPGTYMIDPCLDGRGRFLGYQTVFCDAGGELNATGLQTGLYAHVTSGPVPFPAARKALREHFAKNFGGAL